jgi:hypothetical protein
MTQTKIPGIIDHVTDYVFRCDYTSRLKFALVAAIINYILALSTLPERIVDDLSYDDNREQRVLPGEDNSVIKLVVNYARYLKLAGSPITESNVSMRIRSSPAAFLRNFNRNLF